MKWGYFLSDNDLQNQQADPPGPCTVDTVSLSGFSNTNTVTAPGPTVSRLKLPVVLAEPTIQVHAEANITLTPAATEIKSVKKSVFLDQVKIVPVAPFTLIPGTDFFTFQRAKLFIAGHIRKDLIYTTSGTTGGAGCTTNLQDRVVNINFSGVTELSTAAGTLINPPVIGISESAEANFVSDTNALNARLDKSFFHNLVKFNEQPFGELVAANFFELDFNPVTANPEAPFSTLTEKIVMELTLKVLQLQQISGTFTTVVPSLPGLTPPA